MTEMITIVAVGIGLAGLILNGQRNIREDIKGLEARLEKLDARIGVLERQQAKLEGLLEGLREADIWSGTHQPLIVGDGPRAVPVGSQSKI